jgi:demethylmenaquinone methyltransferase/2-methoxy-6-polyprenyl-1,4-benzoquinol methylase
MENTPRIEASRPDAIRAMFSRISRRYDLANSVLSLGVHGSWRRRLVGLSGARAGDRILDCATGTGDVAIEFQKAAENRLHVTAVDFCPEMMVEGPEKARREGVSILFEQADLTHLPYRDRMFEVVTAAFGIRNVPDPARALAEMARVTRPGGRVLVLEFGQPRGRVLGPAYRAFSSKALPAIGGLLTGDRSAYEYLNRSAAGFPCGDEFLALMRGTGLLATAEGFPLTGGIAYVYRATRI